MQLGIISVEPCCVHSFMFGLLCSTLCLCTSPILFSVSTLFFSLLQSYTRELCIHFLLIDIWILLSFWLTYSYCEHSCSSLWWMYSCFAVGNSGRLVGSKGIHILALKDTAKIKFRPHPAMCGTLVLRPGMEHVSPAVEAWSPNHWTAREAPLSVV